MAAFFVCHDKPQTVSWLEAVVELCSQFKSHLDCFLSASSKHRQRRRLLSSGRGRAGARGLRPRAGVRASASGGWTRRSARSGGTSTRHGWTATRHGSPGGMRGSTTPSAAACCRRASWRGGGTASASWRSRRRSTCPHGGADYVGSPSGRARRSDSRGCSGISGYSSRGSIHGPMTASALEGGTVLLGLRMSRRVRVTPGPTRSGELCLFWFAVA